MEIIDWSLHNGILSSNVRVPLLDKIWDQTHS